MPPQCLIKTYFPNFLAASTECTLYVKSNLSRKECGNSISNPECFRNFLNYDFSVFVLVSQPAGNLLKENVTPKSILFLVIKGEEYLLLEIFLLSAVNSDKSATSYG